MGTHMLLPSPVAVPAAAVSACVIQDSYRPSRALQAALYATACMNGLPYSYCAWANVPR
jgi:hypothetical protein